MRRNWLVSLALVLALGGLIRGITAGALWDPYEVTVAELARRIGLNLLGGDHLAVPGADNSLPIRADLGRGELPFTSAALGFRVFGLADWAGRLPFVLWSLLGLGSLYTALSRLFCRQVALYASLVLATTPLFFLQARALLGDAVTLATFAMAWSGLAVACLGAALPAHTRAAFALLGVLGLYAGFWCRGPIVNVAVPALSVGLAALASRPVERVARWFALAFSVIGALALALGGSGLALANQTGDYSVFVGSALSAAPPRITFEASLGDLAHAAFPWSAAAPLALALVCRRAEGLPERAVVNAAALGLGLSLAASAWLSGYLGSLVPPAVCCLAVLLAVALHEVEIGRLGSPLLGMTVAALSIVIGFDLRTFPDKTLLGFGVTGVSLPESLHAVSSSLWLTGALALAAISVVCLYERDPEPALAPAPPRFARREYAAVLNTLQTLWNGNLLFALLVLEAALVGFLLLSALSERWVSLPQLDGFGSFTRQLVALAAVAVPLSPLLPLAAMVLRDLARASFGTHHSRYGGLFPSRGQGLLLVFATVGGVASLAFYPAVARQLSPREAVQRYGELRRGKEPLGIVGEHRAAARFQGVRDAQTFDAVEPAFAWLSEPDPVHERRWLVLRKADLPELNAHFRELRHTNLPVLDARSSELLLASNRRAPTERDESPLADCVLDAVPAIQHPLHAVLDEKLEVLGWSVRSPTGALEASVAPAKTYRFSIYFRVLSPLRGPWQTFLHIDGLQRRFNADHEPLDGKYPLRLWRTNDVLVDTTDVRLEPNFSPGSYRVYFGLFSGDRRLPVTGGPQSDDRIVAGTLQVR